MELQKVNVKDLDPSTLKEGEILDIPRYQELSLVSALQTFLEILMKILLEK